MPDPVYNSTLAEKFVNSMMWDGKKAVSQKIFYGAMDKIKDTLGASKLRQLGILAAPLTGGVSASVTALVDAWARSHGLPTFAQGGLVTKPTLALIGEAGPEFVIPARPTRRGGLVDRPMPGSMKSPCFLSRRRHFRRANRSETG